MPSTLLPMNAMVMMMNLVSGPWATVDDVVMGGRSASRAVTDEAGLRFEGELSLENNGGFGSIRRVVDGAPTGAQGIKLRVRGDGRSYQLRLRQDRNFDGVAWRARFQSGVDWRELEIPWAAFEPVFRGRRVSGTGPLIPDAIRQIGFLVADGQEGGFRLEVAELRYY